MELLIVFLFYVVQFSIGAITYRRWMKHNSQMQTARSRLQESIASHYKEGTLRDYLEEIVDRKSPLLPSRPILWPSILCGSALVLGMVFMYVVIKFVFPGLNTVFKTIITFISVTPFVFIAFAGIAQEVDDIRILDHARAIRDRLIKSMEDDTTKNTIEDIVAGAQKW